MSGWIDIKLREPTAEDADKEWQEGKVFQKLSGGTLVVWPWDGLYDTVAWMPIPEFVPLPAPPTPTYRPFASAAEFDAFATKPWRFDSDAESMRRPPAIYTDKHHNGETWNQSLATKIFCDGTPFGVKVEE
jgi:hypothetical protein